VKIVNKILYYITSMA